MQDEKDHYLKWGGVIMQILRREFFGKEWKERQKAISWLRRAPEINGISQSWIPTL